MSQLNLYLLGPPRVELDGAPIKVETNKAMALLAYLSVTGKSQRRDSLVVLLWPDHDRTRGRAALRQSLYILNKSLPGDWLKVDRDILGLNPNVDIWVDAKGFHNLIVQCRGHGHSPSEVCPECVEPLTEAAGLYRGDFLEGFGLQDSINFDDWQVSEARSLHAEAVNALERLVDWHVGREEGAGLVKGIGHAQRCLELDRNNEGMHRRLMESYAQTGRRTAALRQYDECVRILKEELGTSPQEETVKLYKAIKNNQVESFKAPSYAPLETPKNNLPIQLTSFIGRDEEMAEIKSLLTTTRLLTLTGAGGCGKTRLALEVGSEVVEEFQDGVWFVQFASLTDQALIPQEVASSLNVREQPGRSISDVLSDYLRAKGLLLILDNCEHLIESCATLSEKLLHSSPNLKVLATSREGLGISGELTYRVPSMSLPDPAHLPPPEDINQYEAPRLFIERAIFSQPTFVATDNNIPVVTQICRRLDGIPLAIELAAARVKSLSVEEITNRLDDRFRLLTGGSRTALPRQQTLRAMIDWSYNLLSEPEKALLNRLSVFSGGWILQAAEEVCADENVAELDSGINADEILDLLSSLVDKSLVITEEASSKDEISSSEEGGGRTRYRLLEMVRQYGRDKLLESGDVERVRDLHFDFFLRFAEEAESRVKGGSDRRVWRQLDLEHDNIRTALGWSQGSGRVEEGLRLAGAVSWSWFVQGHYNEGCEWLEWMLEEDSGAPAPVRAKALRGAGYLGISKGDLDWRIKQGEESLSLYREMGDKSGIAESLRLIGFLLVNQGDAERSIELHEESLRICREVGEKRGIAWSLCLLGMALSQEGDYETASTLYEEGLPLLREVGDIAGISWFHTSWADTLVRLGDLERASVFVEEGLKLSRELRNLTGIVISLYVLGKVAHGRGDYEPAKELYKESLVLAYERGERGERGAGDSAIAYRLEALGGVAVEQGGIKRGAFLFGAAEAIRQAIDSFDLSPYDQDYYDRTVATMRAGMGEEAFAAVWAEGREMSMEEAIEFALSEY